jgi:Sec-independent protein translocase protein TatA
MMFGISLGEMLIIMGVAVILIKPSDMPAVARTCAKLYVKCRDFFAEMRGKFEGLVEQGELDFDAKKPRKAPTFSEQIDKQRKAMGITGNGKKSKAPDLYDEIKDKKTPNLDI